jgi:hypothetical protein
MAAFATSLDDRQVRMLVDHIRSGAVAKAKTTK